jgi:3-oxoacyl-[acyl-carrier protein] reductase
MLITCQAAEIVVERSLNRKGPGVTNGLNGKAIVIIGASSGIGAAVAKKFGALGARLIVHYNGNPEGAEEVVANIRASGGTADLVRGDVSERAEAARVIDEAHAKLGRIDVLINNAGAMFGRTSIANATDEQYDDVVDLNIGSVFFACRKAAKIMEAQRSGSIINTTSVAARNGGSGGAGLYGSAKGFVSTITRVLAKELAPFNVRANAVAPGVIMTPFHQRYSTAEQLEGARQGIPLGRIGTPEDCVGAYQFLADETMSSYITGQVIEVNGGQIMP